MYGIGGMFVRLSEGTGRKKESSGQSPGSPLTAFLSPISILKPFPIILAVVNKVHKTGAVSLLILSYIALFETPTQQTKCMPCELMTFPQMHVGQLEG